ncbi:hypothetical protein AB0I28_18650 [Phytomonospora sp. NPDC050363]|uniref:hypothetical protein n=1 Tax=Phytomonospora sp. NPDC050363 TaxID=3155642 RepID=UPI0033E3D45B
MKRPLIIAACAFAVIVAGAAVLFWKPWSDTAHSAEAVPATCDELAAVPQGHVTDPEVRERTFAFAGAGRLTGEDRPGSTLVCDWNGADGTVVQLRVEYWADGPGAAENEAELADSTEVPGLGDEAALATVGTAGEGLARDGNVIVHARCIFRGEVDVSGEIVAVLEAALTTIGG